MVKLSKKQLKEEASYMEAYYFTGNVYNYENITDFLSLLSYYTKKGKKSEYKKNIKDIEKKLYNETNKNYYNSMQDLIYNVKKIKHDSYTIEKIAYSAGLYGNTGQLHQLKLYNNNNIVAIYALYY